MLYVVLTMPTLNKAYLFIIYLLLLSVTCDRSVVFSSTNKTDHHDIAEFLLKVALNPITLKT